MRVPAGRLDAIDGSGVVGVTDDGGEGGDVGDADSV
jgi:hypothetical protein